MDRHKLLSIARHCLPILTGLYVCFLVTMTHLPVENVPPTPTPDKLLHFGAYGLFGGLIGLTLLAFQKQTFRDYFLAFLLLSLFAAIDEMTQQFVGRSPDFLDWGADLGGLAITLASIFILQRLIQLPRHSYCQFDTGK